MATWLMANTQTEEVDEFEVAAARSPKKRSSSPSKALMRYLSKGKKLVASVRKPKRVPRRALMSDDEDEVVSPYLSRSTFRNTDEEEEYTESSDCVLLDGLVDMYCGGQRSYRSSAEYHVRYFHAEDAAEWPTNLEDSQSSMASFRSTSTTATSASRASTSSSSSSSTILSL